MGPAWIWPAWATADRDVTPATDRLVDSHCHLEAEQFSVEPIEDVLERAAEAGVTRVVTIGTDMATSRAAVALAQEHEAVYGAVAIDPKHLADLTTAAIDELRDLARQPAIVAIGEIGLDYHWDVSPRREQRRAFRAQLELAESVDLPVVIHNRKADTDTADLLMAWASTAELDRPFGVLHCYSGDLVMAEELFDAGFLISVSGVVTYSSAGKTRHVAAGMPDDALVVETDAPYLTPNSRGKGRNEPAFVRDVAERVAQLRGTDLASVAGFTTRNARRLFRWGKS